MDTETVADPGPSGEPPVHTPRQVMSEQNYPKLQADYDSLRRKYRELKGNFDTLKTEHEKLQGEHNEALELVNATEEEIQAVLAEEIGKVAEERDRFKELAETSPDGWKAKYEGLQKEFAVRKHQDKFNEAATKAGVLKEALPDAWSLSGYTPEGDEPDDVLITSSVEGLLKSRPWLKAGTTADAVKPNPDGSGAPDGALPVPQPTSKGRGPGLDRGGSPSGSQTATLRASRTQVADPVWMRNNREAIATATAAGQFSIED